MTIKERWQKQTLFWKIYILAVILLVILVGLIEGFEEYLLEPFLLENFGVEDDIFECVMWIVGVLVPTLLVAQIITTYLSRKFETIADATQRIARGDLNVRLEAENSDDSLGKMTSSFNSMAEDLQRLVKNERRLLADISHELRSPLTRMALAIELANRAPAGESAEYMQRMQTEVNRMTEMLSVLLEHGRDSLNYLEQTEQVDLTELIRSVADDINFQAEQEDKKITCSVNEGLQINGNNVLLDQMLHNIIINAVKYSTPGGTVEISSKIEKQEVQVSISDHGPGVPEESLEDIFRAFYRTDTSRTRDSGGVGLGLAIAKQVALSHGGSISARNCNPGLCVKIRLPLSQAK